MAHVHQHHTQHEHGHAGRAGTAALKVAFFLNLAFTLVEAAGGWWTNSIAVLTDAVHDMGDCIVLGAAWYLQGLSTRGRDTDYSYGYGRYSMLGGWAASIILIVGALFMFTVSIPRLFAPIEPHTTGMMGIAVFGLLMNGLAAWRLHHGSTLNERGVYLHLLEDVLGWAAVLLGAIIIHFTGLALIDPLLSMAISVFILVNAIRTLRRGTGILMQAVPHGVDMRKVRERLMDIPHVVDLHDQHTWTLDGSFVIHTVHVVVNDVDLREARTIKADARERLKELGIHHATIELEWESEDCWLQCH